jgi:hypothetical protein
MHYLSLRAELAPNDNRVVNAGSDVRGNVGFHGLRNLAPTVLVRVAHGAARRIVVIRPKVESIDSAHGTVNQAVGELLR